MEEFQVPEDISDISALQVQTAGRMCASRNLPRSRDESSEALNDRLDAVGSQLEHGEPDALADQGNFDDMFCLVRFFCMTNPTLASHVSDFKYLPSEIKGRVLHVLHGVLRRTVLALGGGIDDGGGGGGGRRSGRGGQCSADLGEGGNQHQGQAELSLRNAYKIAVYLLFSAAFPAEECYSSAKQTAILEKPTRGKGSRKNKKTPSEGDGGSFKWENAREAVLESMRLALTPDASRLWRQGVPDRCFMGLFLRLSCKMLELNETVKNSRQVQLALELISEPFHLALGMEMEFSAAVFLLVRENRHLAEPVAKLCCNLVEKYGDARLGAELVREIGRMDMPDVTSKNAAIAAPVVNVSDFLRELVQVLPGTVHAHASVLLPHLSSRPYQIRNAVVYSLGEVVTAAHKDRKATEQEERTAAEADGAGAAVGGGDGAAGESQVQVDPRRVRMKDRNRDALLDQLVERALDVSPFVRMAVLRVWGMIADRRALPRRRFLVAARLGADRLRDQSSLVRKEAVKLLQILIAYNPYDSTLDLSINEQRSKQAEAELEAMSPPQPKGESCGWKAAPGGTLDEAPALDAESEGGDGNASEEDEVDKMSDDGGNQPEKGVRSDGETPRKTGEKPSEGDKEELEDDEGRSIVGEEAEEDSEKVPSAYEAKVAQCEHLRAAVLFIEELQVAGSRLSGMLGSTTTSDVVEALRFLVTACHFHLPGAMEAIKKSLTLIWRTEGNIEGETKRAFVQVFVSRGDEGRPQESLPAQTVAKNLVGLVNESKTGELASLEEVVASLVKDTLDMERDTVLDPEVFEQLWCAVGTKDQLPRGRAGALHVIAMGASADPSLVNDPQRLEVIREAALGRTTMESRDWRTVRCACIALLRCDPVVVGKSKEVELILTRLSLFLEGKWCASMTEETGDKDCTLAEEEMNYWFAAGEQAIAVLFYLNRAPEIMTATIIRRLAVDTLSSDKASPLDLARLCFVLGHVALKLLVYSEDMTGTLERARAKVKPPPKEKSSGASSEDEGDATAQELGLNAEASAEDEQRLAELTEKEIVGRNLLGVFGPLLVRIVADNNGYFGHPLVRESSVLALSKFMCISEAFCERYLDLLFTTLEKATDTAVRTNIVVALGDLAFRFPNALEPWNPKIYDRLRDDCPRVRANAIMVLTHLILNDMVKVKGQVSGLAVCMVDKEPRIRDAAKVFFHKYSERGTNPVYNVLPDIVGRLSVDTTLSAAEYKEIMDFLMQYVKKDKLTELLAEKLCARLVSSETIRQGQLVSYCLGQLKVTEKAISRLAELMPTYKEKLQDKEVYSNFVGLVNRAKQFASQEMAQAIDEWKAQLEKFHEGGAEDEEAAARASRAASRRSSCKRVSQSTPASTTGAGSRPKVRSGETVGRKKSAESSGRKLKNAPRSRGRKKTKEPLVESDDDSDEEQFDISEEDEGKEVEQEGDAGVDTKRGIAASEPQGKHKRSPVRASSSTVEGEGSGRVQEVREKGRRSVAQSGRAENSSQNFGKDEEEAEWGSEEDIFEPKREMVIGKKRSVAGKENRAAPVKIKTVSGRGGRLRRSRPLSPSN